MLPSNVSQPTFPFYCITITCNGFQMDHRIHHCEHLVRLLAIILKGFSKLFVEVWNLKQDFKGVKLKLIPREKNKEADKLVNEALDNRNKKSQQLL